MQKITPFLWFDKQAEEQEFVAFEINKINIAALQQVYAQP
jgi:predicted 3-demethylubiquinone-9 3-methyltransferase (glyoxalase superfamily)